MRCIAATHSADHLHRRGNAAQPIARNATLGLWTNFVNLLDLAAVALPAGFRPDGLPFGVTIIGQAFSDAALAHYASALHAALGAGAGIACRPVHDNYCAATAEEVILVVAGAHLSGMPLNPQLVDLGARLVRATKTAADYRLYALTTTPPKPGLVHEPGFAGSGIAVELWALMPENFGRFVAALPAPMAIGRVELADGSRASGLSVRGLCIEKRRRHHCFRRLESLSR